MKCMKVLVHQQPYKEILRSFGLEKLFSLRWSSSSWSLIGLICLWIVTLEDVLPNHTWNMIISSKPCFVIIKIKINQTLVSHLEFEMIYSMPKNDTKFHLKFKVGQILSFKFLCELHYISFKPPSLWSFILFFTL